MKNLSQFILLAVLYSITGFSQNTATLETKYFSFQSNPQLNAHLFLYNKAMGCKFKKVPNDSMAFYSFKDQIKNIPANDLSTLNSVLQFYKDSLLGKDLLFDSLMRDFSDRLAIALPVTLKWQKTTLEKIELFNPWFLKLYWSGIIAENKTWLDANKPQVIKLETTIVPALEKIYESKLPEGKKVRIDLTSYATWAGAFSYNNTFNHVIFSSSHRSNQGDLASEVVFHETSHFLVDKLSEQIAVAAKGKDVKQSINLWHNIIFYTTGYVLEKEYSKDGKTFSPYYVQMKFEEKFPDFKNTVEACKLYWNPHIEGITSMEHAAKEIVEFMFKK